MTTFQLAVRLVAVHPLCIVELILPTGSHLSSWKLALTRNTQCSLTVESTTVRIPMISSSRHSTPFERVPGPNHSAVRLPKASNQTNLFFTFATTTGLVVGEARRWMGGTIRVSPTRELCFPPAGRMKTAVLLRTLSYRPMRVPSLVSLSTSSRLL